MYCHLNKIIYFILILIGLSNKLFSQNIYGGEILIENIGGLNYKATVAVSIDNGVNTNLNPYFLLDWGDSSPLDTVRPIGITCGTVAYTKSYTSTHTYSILNSYTLSCYVGNLTSSIWNVPGSSSKSLTLEYYLYLVSGASQNISPVSISCLTNTFSISQNTFNQNSTDSDIDSLSYHLYTPPFLPGFSSTGFSIDNVIGLITNSNSNIAKYLIPVKTEEWRKVTGTNYLVGIALRYHSLIYNSVISVNELEYFNSYEIYPNPATSIINIVDENNELKNSNIQITDYFGQLVFSSPFTSQINLSSLSAGMYFLTIDDKSNKKTVKIIKE